MSPGLKDWEMHYNLLESLEHRLQAVKLVTHLQVHLARSVAEVIAHYNDDILDHITELLHYYHTYFYALSSL